VLVPNDRTAHGRAGRITRDKRRRRKKRREHARAAWADPLNHFFAPVGTAAASHCHLGRGPEAPRHLVGHIFAWQPCVPARCSVIPHSVPVSLHQHHQEASSRRRSFWAYARQNTEHPSNASCMNDVAIWPVATTGSVESARDLIIRPFCIAMCLSMKEGCSICFFCRILIHHHYQHRKKMRI